MNPHRLHYFLSVTALILLNAGSVLAQAQVTSSMTGTWGDPAHNGEGFHIEILEDNAAVVHWFTYNSLGEQCPAHSFPSATCRAA